MKHCAQFVSAACLLAVAVMASTPALADGSITFIHGGIGPVTNINNGDPFDIALTRGGSTVTFLNNTGKTITDFHFTWTGNLTVKGFDDLPDTSTKPYFGSYSATQTSVDFYNQTGGVGIANGEKFEISLSGFGAITPVTANATFTGGKGTTPIPEPQSYALMLGAMSLLSLIMVGKQRNR